MDVKNRKAFFDYDVVEELEAGIVLTGAEVKAVKAGLVGIVGARVLEGEGGWYVIGMNIQKYEKTVDEKYDPARKRKILLHRDQMLTWEAKKKSAGLTVVPLRVYNKGGLIKLTLGLVRGKKKYEKRDELKKRDEVRKLARMTKN